MTRHTLGMLLLASLAHTQPWPIAAEPLRDLWDTEWRRCGLRSIYEPWMLGQLWQESRFRTNAVSPAGAIGLAQVMPGTDQLLRHAYPKRYATLEGGPDAPTVALRALCLLTLEGLRAMHGAPNRKVRWRFNAYIYNGGYWIRAEQNMATRAGVNRWNWQVVFDFFCGRALLNNHGPRSPQSCNENREYPEHAFKFSHLFQ